jgi:uncharacterized protein with HEPN domain
LSRMRCGRGILTFDVRNVLIHACATVNDRLVWGVVEQHLGPLVEVLSLLLPDEDH